MSNDDLPLFKQHQYAFTAHLRSPDNVAKPGGIEERRMAVYRDLFFNNVKSFLDNGFPVLQQLHSEAAWERLARSYFSEHRAHSPYFVDISKSFIEYLQNEYQLTEEDHPFLVELAHYEWVELALMTSTEELSFIGVERYASLLESRPLISPLARCFGYQWPVHQIRPDNVPDEPLAQPVFIIVYRNSDGEVKFIEANPVTAHLFECLQEEGVENGQQLLENIAAQLQHPNPDIVVQGGLQTLTRWHHLGIILGGKEV